MNEFFKETYAKYKSLNMVHFCSFEHVDQYLKTVKERSEVYLDIKRKVLKVVCYEADTNFSFVKDYKITQFKQDKHAWYFWLRNNFIDSKSGEYFGFGVAKDGRDFWGKLKPSEKGVDGFRLEEAV